MKLLFDEDVGKGIPVALRSVGIRDVEYIGRDPRLPKGAPDETWLPFAYLLTLSGTKTLVNLADPTTHRRLRGH